VINTLLGSCLPFYRLATQHTLVNWDATHTRAVAAFKSAPCICWRKHSWTPLVPWTDHAMNIAHARKVSSSHVVAMHSMSMNMTQMEPTSVLCRFCPSQLSNHPALMHKHVHVHSTIACVCTCASVLHKNTCTCMLCSC
jgi:hypothetical protein